MSEWKPELVREGDIDDPDAPNGDIMKIPENGHTFEQGTTHYCDTEGCPADKTHLVMKNQDAEFDVILFGRYRSKFFYKDYSCKVLYTTENQKVHVTARGYAPVANGVWEEHHSRILGEGFLELYDDVENFARKQHKERWMKEAIIRTIKNDEQGNRV